MLIKLESGDYINPDRVDGITMFENGIDIVAMIHFGGRNGFHITQNDLDQILEWHNGKEKTTLLAGQYSIADCQNCKFWDSVYNEKCQPCGNYKNFQPKD